jgi:hypothetical protein
MSSHKLAQIQLLTLKVLLQCEVKESKEDWRSTPVRREGGKFAASDTPSKASGVKEVINKATQSVVRGLASQISQQVKRLPPQQRDAIPEILDSPAGLFVKKKIRALIDPEGQAAFDRTTEKMRGKGENLTFSDRVKSAGQIAQEELKAAATSPIAVTKGVLGGLAWPLLAVHGLSQLDDDLALYREAGKLSAIFSGAAILQKSIQDINDKAQVNLDKKEQQQLKDELNEFFLGIKSLEESK